MTKLFIAKAKRVCGSHSARTIKPQRFFFSPVLEKTAENENFSNKRRRGAQIYGGLKRNARCVDPIAHILISLIEFIIRRAAGTPQFEISSSVVR
jgi:hypothetical protein